ncbi:MAG: PCRF domain-containing protein [Alphaproteobacteria bacterium]|nr:PCRF domain-containing protein [Alphaproteobacteria bacterium]
MKARQAAKPRRRKMFSCQSPDMGAGVWSALGYEAGTHQVKRVPRTEAQGRVHTSTATVAVLAEPEDVEQEVDAEEVREILGS